MSEKLDDVSVVDFLTAPAKALGSALVNWMRVAAQNELALQVAKRTKKFFVLVLIHFAGIRILDHTSFCQVRWVAVEERLLIILSFDQLNCIVAENNDALKPRVRLWEAINGR